MSDSFTIYRSVFNALKAYPAEYMKEALIMIGEYAMDETPPNADAGIAYGLFCTVKPLIDSGKRKAEAGRKGGEANGSKPEANGSKPEANGSKPEANGSKPEANKKEESINIKEPTPKGVGKKSRFAPPTPEEVSDYCKEKGYTNVDAERFVAFYESKGWMVGKNKMTDWKAAVRNWNRSERPEKSAKPTGQEVTAPKNRFNNFQQREYDYAALERQLLGR